MFARAHAHTCVCVCVCVCGCVCGCVCVWVWVCGHAGARVHACVRERERATELFGHPVGGLRVAHAEGRLPGNSSLDFVLVLHVLFKPNCPSCARFSDGPLFAGMELFQLDAAAILDAVLVCSYYCVRVTTSTAVESCVVAICK
jgi:hypothetical protein